MAAAAQAEVQEYVDQQNRACKSKLVFKPSLLSKLNDKCPCSTDNEITTQHPDSSNSEHD